MEREAEIVLKAENRKRRETEKDKGGEKRKATAIKWVIAWHGGKYLFKFPPEVSYTCKCCGRLLGGKTPWAPYLKGAFRSTILICPSIPSESNFKDSSHFHANRPTPEWQAGRQLLAVTRWREKKNRKRSDSLTLDSTLELAAVLIFTVDDGFNWLCSVCAVVEIIGCNLKRGRALNMHAQTQTHTQRHTHTHFTVEFSRGGSHAPWKLVLSRGVNKSS